MSHLSHLVLLPCLALLALALLVRLPPPHRSLFVLFTLIILQARAELAVCPPGTFHHIHSADCVPCPPGTASAQPDSVVRTTRGLHTTPRSAQTPDLMSTLCLPTIEVHPVWSGLRGCGCGQHALHGVRAGILVGGRQGQMHPVPAPFLLGRWRHPLRPVQLFGPVIDLSCIYTCICLVYYL